MVPHMDGDIPVFQYVILKIIIKVVSDLEITHLPMVGVVYEQFHWPHLLVTPVSRLLELIGWQALLMYAPTNVTPHYLYGL